MTIIIIITIIVLNYDKPTMQHEPDCQASCRGCSNILLTFSTAGIGVGAVGVWVVSSDGPGWHLLGYGKRGGGRGGGHSPGTWGHTRTDGRGSRRNVRTHGHLAAPVVGVKGHNALGVKVVVFRAPVTGRMRTRSFYVFFRQRLFSIIKPYTCKIASESKSEKLQECFINEV